jgi:septum site-determining protein MinC
MRSFFSEGVPPGGSDGADDDGAHDLFVTETMAELSARQGRLADAAAIYRRLLAGAAADDRRQRWRTRLASLDGAAATGAPGSNAAAAAPGSAPAAAPRPVPAPTPTPTILTATIWPPTPAPARPAAASPRMALVIAAPVRSGQIVYAEGRDLIVVAPVNPGAQLMADGHIHVYAPLRGRAVAGVRGATDAQIFCHRLEAELVGIDAAYVPADGLPADLMGKAVRIWLAGGICRFSRI